MAHVIRLTAWHRRKSSQSLVTTPNTHMPIRCLLDPGDIILLRLVLQGPEQPTLAGYTGFFNDVGTKVLHLWASLQPEAEAEEEKPATPSKGKDSAKKPAAKGKPEAAPGTNEHTVGCTGISKELNARGVGSSTVANAWCMRTYHIHVSAACMYWPSTCLLDEQFEHVCLQRTWCQIPPERCGWSSTLRACKPCQEVFSLLLEKRTTARASRISIL